MYEGRNALRDGPGIVEVWAVAHPVRLLYRYCTDELPVRVCSVAKEGSVARSTPKDARGLAIARQR